MTSRDFIREHLADAADFYIQMKDLATDQHAAVQILFMYKSILRESGMLGSASLIENVGGNATQREELKKKMQIDLTEAFRKLRKNELDGNGTLLRTTLDDLIDDDKMYRIMSKARGLEQTSSLTSAKIESIAKVVGESVETVREMIELDNDTTRLVMAAVGEGAGTADNEDLRKKYDMLLQKFKAIEALEPIQLELQKRYEQQMIEIQALRNENAVLIAKMRQNDAEKARILMDNKKIVTQQRNLLQKAKQTVQSQNEVKKLKGQVKDLEETLRANVAQVEKLEKENEHLIENGKRISEQSQQQVVEMQNDLREFKRLSLEEYQKESAELIEDNNKIVKEYAEEIEEEKISHENKLRRELHEDYTIKFEQEKNNLVKSLQRKSEKRDDKYNNRVKELEEQIRKLSIENIHLNDNHMEHLKNMEEKYSAQVEAHRVAAEKSQEALKEHSEEYRKLHEKHIETMKKHEDAIESHDETLESKKKSEEKILKMHSSLLEDKKELHEVHEELGKELESLRESLQNANLTHDELKEDHDMLKKKTMELYKEHCGVYDNSYIPTDAEAQALKDYPSLLDNCFNIKQKGHEELEKKYSALDKKANYRMKRVIKQVGVLKGELDEKIKKYEELQDHKDDLEDDNERLEGDNNELKELVKGIQEENEENEKKIASIEKINRGMMNVLESLGCAFDENGENMEGSCLTLIRTQVERFGGKGREQKLLEVLSDIVEVSIDALNAEEGQRSKFFVLRGSVDLNEILERVSAGEFMDVEGNLRNENNVDTEGTSVNQFLEDELKSFVEAPVDDLNLSHFINFLYVMSATVHQAIIGAFESDDMQNFGRNATKRLGDNLFALYNLSGIMLHCYSRIFDIAGVKDKVWHIENSLGGKTKNFSQGAFLVDAEQGFIFSVDESDEIDYGEFNQPNKFRRETLSDLYASGPRSWLNKVSETLTGKGIEDLDKKIQEGKNTADPKPERGYFDAVSDYWSGNQQSLAFEIGNGGFSFGRDGSSSDEEDERQYSKCGC